MRQRGALGVFDILQQAAGGAQAAGGVFHAEADQIAGAELQVKLLARGVDFKFPQRATAQAAAAFDQRRFGKIFRVQQFRRISTLQLCRHGFAVGRFAQAEAAGADVQRRVAKAFAVLPDGGQQVVLTLLQQRFIADGARRDDTHHFTLDRPFGGGRVAYLLANSYRLALINQFRKIVFHRVVGDAGHGNGFARGGAAFGQRDIEQLRRAFRIVIKQLVKIPHPVKQQNVRMLRLQLEILLHHGGMAREVLINVFIHIDFTHFLILSSAHMAPGKTPLNPHKPINL
ncbi:hypothetical protein SB00610_00768 [Klebsiella quasipneumoniae subsp. similipneumoniae]|nr:hypothetical protein SB00610_00768 [Klebsiella quasipneumoniae subsp. similipneumoniae]